MTQASTFRSPGASSSYVELGWNTLSDDRLINVRWSTDDPLALPNLQAAVPDDLGDFQIELAYDLSPDVDPVPCAHCPQHQRHRHGFVLHDDQGRRYLLGSTCGPKAYGTDYRLASSARNRAKSRFDLLKRWDRISEALPDHIADVAAVVSGARARILKSARLRLERDAPRTVARLRQVRPDGSGGSLRLFAVEEYRDDEAEEAIMARFLQEVRQLAEQRLTNRQHAFQLKELKTRLGAQSPVMKTREVDFGTLEGADWIRMDHCPASELADVVARLRGLVAIGRTTQDKPTRRLSQIVRQAEVDLQRAATCVSALETASAFFSPNHLVAMSRWLNSGANQPGRSDCERAKWEVTESRRDAVLIDFTSAL